MTVGAKGRVRRKNQESKRPEIEEEKSVFKLLLLLPKEVFAQMTGEGTQSLGGLLRDPDKERDLQMRHTC